jgi:hypothetical protein
MTTFKVMSWPLAALLAIAAGCDRSPESNGGPRVAAFHAERAPYPAVEDLPRTRRASTAEAEIFILVDGDEMVRLGTRGSDRTTDVSLDELLRAFWRIRRDPLGGRGAATPSAAPLLLAGSPVPARAVVDVVGALWQHGARLAVGGGPPGSAREHPVRMLIEPEPGKLVPGGAFVELGTTGLSLTMPGEEPHAFDQCGPTPDTGCLARALDSAADAGARTVFLRRTRQALK